LQKLFGPDYYFSIDYSTLAQYRTPDNASKRYTELNTIYPPHFPKLGEFLHGKPEGHKYSYAGAVVTNLEEWAKDELNAETFKAKTPARAVVIRLGKVLHEEDSSMTHKQTIEDGAYIITVNPTKLMDYIYEIGSPAKVSPLL